jgi:uncharacterized protein (DUF58 family)
MPVLQQDFRQFDQLDLLAKQVVEGFIIGLHKSPYHGFSVEFAEHRIYNQGDSVKNVDWKAYAKTGKMYSKKFEEETNLRCQLVIDVSGSMRFPTEPAQGALNKLEFSCVAAAALMYLLKKQRDAAGLSLISDSIAVHTPARTNAQHHQMMMNHLHRVLKQPESFSKVTRLAGSLHQIAELTHRRSLVFLFSDFLEDESESDELFSALQHLKHNKHEIVIFHVTKSAEEIAFKFENRPYHFIDMETGDEIKLLPGQVKEYYLKLMDQKKKSLSLKCAQYKIDFIEADIDQGFDSILQAYLIKRNSMRV